MPTLKEATALKHKEAERMPFNIRMFEGAMSEQDYLKHLIQQQAIFATLEQNPLPHPSLNRSEAVLADIVELTDKGAKTEPVLQSTQNYTSYLSTLPPEAQLPHVYLNYLAIMYGGQMMKSKVPSSGSMYEFDDMKEGLQSVRAVQRDDWADEVNRAYDYIIAIFDELEQVSQKAST